ncbi:MAG: (2Fe-2S)-binding protein [Pseudomonadota bacterium]|nr:(2Fe-2S)-binding protein [Pseudomonadota bacterium]
MTARRIGERVGARPLSFRFDGRSCIGREGDTIASALIANNVRIVGRSFKYRRPRGIWGAGVEEPNAIVDVKLAGRSTPNVLATTTPLAEGMDIRAGAASPSAERDPSAVLDWLAPFLPSGFYYKTFLWPSWGAYEPRIREMAGLGRLDPANAPPADCPRINATCDALVVGAGPAGLAAARAAARAGLRVMLVDDQPAPGGALSHRPARIEGADGLDWAAGVVAELADKGARVLANATAYGVYQHNLVCVWQRRFGAPDALWRVRAKTIVVAAGAIERPLVFPDNDRPGVMSAEAALIYLRRHDLRVGERVVVATNNSGAYAVARALRDAGARVTVADFRTRDIPAIEGLDIRPGASIDAVHGRTVEAVTISGARLEADTLLISGGRTPSVHLHAQAQGKLRYDETRAALVPAAAVAGLSVVGAANGTFDLGPALAEAQALFDPASPALAVESAEPRYAIEPAWPKPGSKGRQWIDFQNDVTLKDVELAARENFQSVEHLKRYTTLGMANDQGKTSNLNGLAALAATTGRTIAQTGTTTYRPPFTPVPLAIIGGRRRGELFNPVRRLGLEPEHRRLGAVMREYGGWLRPAWYGEGEAAIAREAEMARASVGVLDASPLGKIEVFGPQAGALVDFNSYNTISTLKPMRIRYGFMLTETGFVYDDGVVAKVNDQHYIVSCSSGHVAGVVARLEEWRQDRFDPARVTIHNSTLQWATLTATGPQAKALVASLDLRVDFDDSALPHMSFVDAVFAGRPARVARVSFTGDRSYEISTPARLAPELLRAMLAAAERLGGGPLGSEALLLLRAEKGYLIVGKDSDGVTMPHDLGLMGPRAQRKNEYVGKRSLFTDSACDDNRRHFVGLAASGAEPLPTGAHAIETGGGRRRSIGFVTSSYVSPTLGRPIALGLIERGRARIGETVELQHLGRSLTATICAPCFLDPEGVRLNA